MHRIRVIPLPLPDIPPEVIVLGCLVVAVTLTVHDHWTAQLRRQP